jgi:hypothetical protein
MRLTRKKSLYTLIEERIYNVHINREPNLPIDFIVPSRSLIITPKSQLTMHFTQLRLESWEYRLYISTHFPILLRTSFPSILYHLRIGIVIRLTWAEEQDKIKKRKKNSFPSIRTHIIGLLFDSNSVRLSFSIPFRFLSSPFRLAFFFWFIFWSSNFIPFFFFEKGLSLSERQWKEEREWRERTNRGCLFLGYLWQIGPGGSSFWFARQVSSSATSLMAYVRYCTKRTLFSITSF